MSVDVVWNCSATWLPSTSDMKNHLSNRQSELHGSTSLTDILDGYPPTRVRATMVIDMTCKIKHR